MFTGLSTGGEHVPTVVDSHGCLHHLFAARAGETPDVPAVVHGTRSVTYGQLASRSTDLARRLRDAGVGPDVLVGLYLDRSIEMLAAMVAVLTAGGAYVPLSTTDPAERVSYMIDDAGIGVVLTASSAAGRLPALPGPRLDVDGLTIAGRAPVAAAPVAVTPDHLAYLIYTSGTTGQPKGVAVPHRAAVRIVRSGIYADFGADETFLQACALSFDASVFEIWACLANGGRLVLLPDQRPSAEAIVDAVRAHGVSTLWLTPSLFNRAVDAGLLDGCPLRQVVVGGEVLSTAHLGRAMASTGARFSNGYGPTEAGVFACGHRFEAVDLALTPPPVGRPLPGTEVHVLDGDLRPVPDGERGELCIGGDALARGYHRRAALTAERFVPHPFASTPGARLYRTGDVARSLPGGLFQVLGRVDGQVKIRGHRVELAEVEAALLDQPGVAQAAVIDRDQNGERRLVAYLVPGAEARLTVTGLRAGLARRLPDFMIPSEFSTLEGFPLTRHGKADRAALRAGVAATALPLGTAFVSAATELEVLIGRVWAETLDVPSVGLDDNYFDLGGTSLLVGRVRGLLEGRLGLRLPSTVMYEYPTIRKLALAISREEVGR
jgi:amino acid adenylation domain-containing protein